MRVATRLSVAAATALLVGAAPAGAQVNYYTQGYFTTSPVTPTCNASMPALGAPADATCSGGGFTLTYSAVPQSPVPIGTGSTISLGNFFLSGVGNVTVPDNTVNFTLLIRQTAPTPGTGTFLGYITGAVSSNPATSTLEWTPNQLVNIGPVQYRMIFDNVGVAANTGLAIPINFQRGINAQLAVVPEPGTYVLMAAGLGGLLVAARRRRMV